MKSYRKELWFNVPTRRAFINITREDAFHKFHNFLNSRISKAHHTDFSLQGISAFT